MASVSARAPSRCSRECGRGGWGSREGALFPGRRQGIHSWFAVFVDHVQATAQAARTARVSCGVACSGRTSSPTRSGTRAAGPGDRLHMPRYGSPHGRLPSVVDRPRRADTRAVRQVTHRAVGPPTGLIWKDDIGQTWPYPCGYEGPSFIHSEAARGRSALARTSPLPGRARYGLSGRARTTPTSPGARDGRARRARSRGRSAGDVSRCMECPPGTITTSYDAS